MIEKIVRFFYRKRLSTLEDKQDHLKSKIVELTNIIDKQMEDYNVLLNSIDILVWLKYSPYTIDVANKAFCKFFGIDMNEFENGPINISKVLPIECEPCILSSEKCFTTGEEDYKIRHIENADGEERILQIKKKPKKNGIVKYVVCTAIDMTQHFKIQEALRRKTEELQTLYDISFASIFISQDGYCVNQNKTAEEMFGYTLEESYKKSGLEWIIPEHREIVKERMLNGSEEAYHVTALRKDGSTFPCEIQGRMFKYKDQPYRMTVLRDLTNRINLEC